MRFARRPGAWAKVCPPALATLVLLAAAVSLSPGQSSGGRAVSFGTDTRISGYASDPPDAFYGESAIASSPADPGNLVAAYMRVIPHTDHNRPCHFSTSLDGGMTWPFVGEVPVGGPQTGCSDPSVAADDQGTFYLGSVNDGVTPSGESFTDIRVARSTDGGRSYQSFVAVHQGPDDYLDKPYLTVDAQSASPFRGTVYVAYANLNFYRAGIQVVASRDGANTWSEPIWLELVHPGVYEHQGAVPVVAPDGTAYIFCATYDLFDMFAGILFSKSTDGGQTWSRGRYAALGLPSPGLFNLKNADKSFGTAPDRGLDANSFPSVAITPDGSIFVAWTDFPKGTCRRSPQLVPYPPCTNSDVRMIVSRDGGATWTAPVRINDDRTGTDQFFPWLTAHADGLVSIAWIDRRLDRKNVNYDLFYSNTYDGVSFLPNVRVSTATSIPGLNTWIGDYNGITVTGGAILPAWGDLRNPAGSQIRVRRGTLAP